MKTIFLVAGEASGDFLGAHFMKTLKEKYRENINFEGIGGPQMKAEGLQTWFSYDELSVVGLAEILPHMFRILRRLEETFQRVKRLSPNLVVTIDSPGFNLQLAKKIRRAGIKIPLIHYVAPQVWAWKARRVNKMKALFDHVMCLFPFEPHYFQRVGLPATFVGHPLVEMNIERDPGFLARHSIPEASLRLVVLPGSRQGEITRHVPIFQQACLLVQQQKPDLHLLIPTLPHLKDAIAQSFQGFPIPHTIFLPEEKFQALSHGHIALAASGTVTLELALSNLPAVIGYRLSPLTYAYARRFIRIPYISLINLLLDSPLLAEFVQNRCNPESLCEALILLIQNGERREAIQQGYKKALESLHSPVHFYPRDALFDVVQQYL